MADINVQRRGTSIWPWILGLLVASLLVWALMNLFRRNTQDVRVVEPATEVQRQEVIERRTVVTPVAPVAPVAPIDTGVDSAVVPREDTVR